jgi:HD-like signal output (HDOD) protein
MSAIVQETLRRVTTVETLPSIAAAIMRIADDPTSTSDALDALLSSDPALASRVIKVVNSAFYGRSGNVASTAQAIRLLGVQAIRNIAVAASMTRMFRGGHAVPGFDPPSLWVHAVAVGAAARKLAEMTKLVPPEEALLAGLVHDIGMLVEMQVWLPEFSAVLTAVDADATLEFTDVEQSIIGATHEAIGEALCREWKFPRDLALAVGHHHNPMALPPDARVLPSMVHMADVIAARADIGYTRTVRSREIAPEIFRVIGLRPDDLESIEHALVSELTQAMVLFAG